MHTKWVLRWLAVFSFTCIICVLIGMYLDTLFNSAPCMILLLLAYAIGGNFYKLWKELNKDG